MINEIGNKYGKLTVISKAPKSPRQIVFWNCLCDCGNTTVTSGVDLRKGESKSCGKCNREYQKIPMVGKVFGKLTVIQETELRARDGSIKYLCRCECGKNTVVSGKYLRSKKLVLVGV